MLVLKLFKNSLLGRFIITATFLLILTLIDLKSLISNLIVDLNLSNFDMTKFVAQLK